MPHGYVGFCRKVASRNAALRCFVAFGRSVRCCRVSPRGLVGFRRNASCRRVVFCLAARSRGVGSCRKVVSCAVARRCVRLCRNVASCLVVPHGKASRCQAARRCSALPQRAARLRHVLPQCPVQSRPAAEFRSEEYCREVTSRVAATAPNRRFKPGRRFWLQSYVNSSGRVRRHQSASA